MDEGLISVEDRLKLMEDHSLQRRSLTEQFEDRRSMQERLLKTRMRGRKAKAMRRLKEKQMHERKEVVRFASEF